MSDARLSEQIVSLIRTETEQRRQESWTQLESVAMPVNDIATRLGVPHLAVNGALATLHGQKRVLGFHVVTADGHDVAYVIALYPGS